MINKASVNVQKSKFVVQVIGYGVNKEKWLMDRFDIDQSERLREDENSFMPIDPRRTYRRLVLNRKESD